MKTLIVTFTILAFSGLASAKSIKLSTLPPMVQKTINENLNGAEIKNIAKEVENGATQYEVETMLNGKHRDFNVDAKGALIVVEQEVDINTIPAAAKAAIEKKATGGTITMVETVTKGETVNYEGILKSKAGKKSTLLVNAAGTEVKD